MSPLKIDLASFRQPQFVTPQARRCKADKNHAPYGGSARLLSAMPVMSATVRVLRRAGDQSLKLRRASVPILPPTACSPCRSLAYLNTARSTLAARSAIHRD